MKRSRNQSGRRIGGLHPKVCGFLFSVNPQHVENARRELQVLLSEFTEQAFPIQSGPTTQSALTDGDDDEIPSVTGVDSSCAPVPNVAALLAEELIGECRLDQPPNRVRQRGSQRSSYHPFLRELDTRVKGYLFWEFDKGLTNQVFDQGSIQDPAAEAGEISDVLAIATRLIQSLLQRPRLVTRFSFRFFPIIAAVVPIEEVILQSIRMTALSVTWHLAEKKETETNKYQPPQPLVVSFSVRNNSNVEKNKHVLQNAIFHNAQLDPKKFLVFQRNPPADNIALPPFGNLGVIVLQSTAVIFAQPMFLERREYNLSKLQSGSVPILKDLTDSIT